MVEQGGLALLQEPIAQELLESKIPARLAYTWLDGTPRVVPIWFHWTGEEVVMGTPPRAPKLRALTANPRVALTIDDNAWPNKVLLMRGSATVEQRNSVTEEYAASAHRYFAEEQAREWVAGLQGVPMARIGVRPDWVGLLDFQTRFPSALSM